MTPQPYYIAGLDLGQAADFTALAVAEVAEVVRPEGAREYHYSIRKLERWPLRTPYPKVIEDVRALLESPPLAKHTTLVVDATGVGRPVVDAFRAARLAAPLMAILITGGDSTLYDENTGFWRVPKRDLVGVLAVVLQTRRFKVAPALEHAQTLLREMQTFKVKIDPVTAHDSYSAWREGDHDDLVLAAALLCWRGEHGRPASLGPGQPVTFRADTDTDPQYDDPRFPSRMIAQHLANVAAGMDDD